LRRKNKNTHGRNFESFNVSVATGIVLFEGLKQRLNLKI